MKVEQIEPKKIFKPIVITLESQEEVEALAAIFNHALIAKCLEPAFQEDAWRKFVPFYEDSRANCYHLKLCEIIK